jgi:hypothetical protein
MLMRLRLWPDGPCDPLGDCRHSLAKQRLTTPLNAILSGMQLVIRQALAQQSAERALSSKNQLPALSMRKLIAPSHHKIGPLDRIGFTLEHFF